MCFNYKKASHIGRDCSKWRRKHGKGDQSANGHQDKDKLTVSRVLAAGQQYIKPRWLVGSEAKHHSCPVKGWFCYDLVPVEEHFVVNMRSRQAIVKDHGSFVVVAHQRIVIPQELFGTSLGICGLSCKSESRWNSIVLVNGRFEIRNPGGYFVWYGRRKPSGLYAEDCEVVKPRGRGSFGSKIRGAVNLRHRGRMVQLNAAKCKLFSDLWFWTIYGCSHCESHQWSLVIRGRMKEGSRGLDRNWEKTVSSCKDLEGKDWIVRDGKSFSHRQLSSVLAPRISKSITGEGWSPRGSASEELKVGCMDRRNVWFRSHRMRNCVSRFLIAVPSVYTYRTGLLDCNQSMVANEEKFVSLIVATLWMMLG